MTTLSFKNAILTISLFVLSINAFSQNDDRMKIRLGFTSVNNIHRQILVTVDENTTAGIDFGYDAENFENHQDDMYWMIDDRKFTIQGIDVLDQDSVLPIGIHTGTDGVNTILVEELINVPEALEIVVFDNQTSTYHNIKDNSGFSIDLPAGSYLNRFELRFVDLSDDSTDTPSDEVIDDTITLTENDTEETEANITLEEAIETEDVVQNISFRFINNTKTLSIENPTTQIIQSVNIYNFNGQLKAQYNVSDTQYKTVIRTNNLNAGNYVVVINTNTKNITKKILVN